jgi:ubiquinone/menaquinone biosynthesis C-methylase UbiE
MPAGNTQEVVESLLPKGNKKVLDVGCGEQLEIGHVWKFSGYEIHRCDIKSFDNIPNFISCDLNKRFPYADGEFGGVIAVEMLEHLENPRHVMRELKRISNDFILITFPNCCSPESKIRFNETGFFKYFDTYKPYGHITPIFPWMIKQICDEIGLDILVETFNNKNTQEIYIAMIRRKINV